MKIVINTCYGGFSLSPEASLWLYERGYDSEKFKTPVGEYFERALPTFTKEHALDKWHSYLSGGHSSLFLTVFTPDEKFVLYSRDIERTHPLLIECVETLGEKASGRCSDLKIVEIPDDVEYEIEEYDGNEWIAEKHRTWS